MSAYLKFFEFEQSPFEGKAQSHVVLGTRALREAFATIRDGLEEDAARICLNGGRGMGKTSLARALPKLLADSARVAVVLDPSLSWDSLRGSISKQWGLEGGGLPRAGLVEAARVRRLVLVIDQAERASEEFLDYLDVLLSYRSENDEPVVQSVLLARLHGDGARDPVPLIWWLDRIQTLQLEFAPLPREGVEPYVRKHLKRAGWRGGELFTPDAALAIHGYTAGIPGEISSLCERLLVRAAEHQLAQIDDEFVHAFFDDIEGVERHAAKSGVRGGGGRDGELDLEQEVDDPTQTQGAFAHAAFGRGFDDEVEGENEGGIEAGLADEPFEAEAADLVGSSTDAMTLDEHDDDLFSIEHDLSRPASPEELRAILGSVFAQHARTIAGAALAALVGGLLLAWCMAPSRTPEIPAAAPGSTAAQESFSNRSPGHTVLDVTKADGGTGSASDSAAPVLARMRGPVRETSAPGAAPEGVSTRTSPDAKARIGAGSTDDEDEDIPEGELIDLRPADLIPPSESPAAAGDGF